MNSQTKNEITLMQYIFLIYGAQVGVGLLQFPSNVAKKAGTSGWISVILGGVLVTIVSLIIIQIMKKHPNGTILDLITTIFGKWIGKLFTLFFIFYFGLIAILILLTSFLFLQSLVFPQIQYIFLILLITIPNYLIVRNNIRNLGRYAEIVFFMTIWMVLLFITPITQGNALHLLPIIKEGWVPILSAVKETLFSYMGFEIAFFLYPFLARKELAAKGIIIANMLTMLHYLFITVAAYIFYSPNEVTDYFTPTVNMMKVVEFRFVERVEIIALSFYTLVMSTTWLPYIFLTVFCSSQLVNKKDHRTHLIWFLLAIIIYVFAFPPTFPFINEYTKWMEKWIIGVCFVFPIFIWLIVSVHGLVQRRISK